MRGLSVFIITILLFSCSDNPIGPGDPGYTDPDARIIFVSDRDGEYKLYIMKPDGSDVTKLADNVVSVDLYSRPRLSPDGTKILFMGQDGYKSDIFVVNHDGTNLTNLTESENDPEANPMWSSDGQYIVYSKIEETGSNIYTMNSDGSNKINRTNNQYFNLRPAWSPDNNTIGYCSIQIGGLIREIPTVISTLELPNSMLTVHETTTEHYSEVYNLEFSPTDNDRVLYTISGGTELALFTMDISTNQRTKLTDSNSNAAYGAFSPDGSRIVYMSNASGSFDIWVMNSDGSGKAQLTDTPDTEWMPSWSPDGYKIVYYTDPDLDNNLEIFIMNMDGTGRTRLTNSEGNDIFAEYRIISN